MLYKALMLDLDGTLIPYDHEALPSRKVREAVKKAQGTVSICIVTGRSLHSVTNMFPLLGIKKGYAVLNNGAQVFALETNKLHYDQPIMQKDLALLVATLLAENIAFYLKDEAYEMRKNRICYQHGQPLSKTYMLYTDDVLSDKKANHLINLLHPITGLTIHKTHHKLPDKYALNITHSNATKLHGIHVVQKLLGVTQEETIGIGDSYNDFPLLMACGLKVAMGNAVEDLKEIADVIAPPVTEDGVASIIERYILSNTKY